MVTSESTALMAIRSDANTGRPTRMKLLAARLAGEARRPAIRPATMKINTGKPMVPKAPRGSRRKILISIQVSLKSPRIML
jgi:hypothetical protein